MVKLSIIIPVWNQERLITRCLDSIPARDDIEVLVIDDCSTDNTMKVLKGYDRIPITIFQTPANSGPGVARNIGYDNASGEWIYGMDSDDYAITDKLNWMIDTLYDDVPYDLIHLPIQVNNGGIWNKNGDCNAVHTYTARRSIIGDTRMPEYRRAEDALFLGELLKKKPRIGFGRDAVYHYNYPCEGSITWNYEHHKVDKYGEKI